MNFSYGFRPGRKAHDAVHQAQSYLNDGYIWIVDIDMEKFFDRVNHDRLKQKTDGWVSYFYIADAIKMLGRLDSWLRFRVRMCIWKQWKRVRTRFRELRRLGMSVKDCLRAANTRKGYCRTAHNPFLQSALSNKCLREMGYSELLAVYFLRNSV